MKNLTYGIITIGIIALSPLAIAQGTMGSTMGSVNNTRSFSSTTTTISETSTPRLFTQSEESLARDTNSSSVSYGIVGKNETLPTGTSFVTKGEIVGINEKNHTMRVRDAETGSISTRTIKSDRNLANYRNGEVIQLYSTSR